VIQLVSKRHAFMQAPEG